MTDAAPVDQLRVGDRTYRYRPITRIDRGDVASLPYSLKVLLENLARHSGDTVTQDGVTALAAWDPHAAEPRELAFTPARILLQDFTGVPAIVDLAAMRDAVGRLGGEADSVNPSPRPASSSPTGPPAAGCATKGCPSTSSTPSAPVAATTR